MATAVKRKLSGSTDGTATLAVSASTPGTIVHTAVSGTTPGTYDEIWLWAYNGHTANVSLTVEFGGTAVPNQNIVVTIPFKAGLVPVVPGLLLQNGAIVRIFASVVDVVTVIGFVNSITD